MTPRILEGKGHAVQVSEAVTHKHWHILLDAFIVGSWILAGMLTSGEQASFVCEGMHSVCVCRWDNPLDKTL